MSLSMNEFASRPVSAAWAVRDSMLVLGAIALIAVGKALSAQAPIAPAMAEPAAIAPTVAGEQLAAANGAQSTKDVCRQVVVETDEGYGVRGHVTRWVCRKAY